MNKTTRRRTTPEDRRKIADLYQAGATWQAISAETGWSINTVCSALGREGVNVGKRPGSSKTPAERRTCEVCKGPLGYVAPSLAAQGLGRFCSQRCMGDSKRLPPSHTGNEAAELLCHRCDQTKPVDDFYPHKKTARGRQYWCKTCCQKARRERAKVPLDPRVIRRYALKTAYGITPEEYDAMYEQQDGCCAICKGHREPWAPGGGIAARHAFLAVDHEHSTGKVRGLLCWNCNCGIGQLKDDPDTLIAAAMYLGWDPAAL